MGKYKLEFESIGTKWVIDGKLSKEQTSAKISDKIKSLIEGFDKHYSRFRKDSLVFKMSQLAGKYALPEDAQKMLDLYKKLYSLTGGKFTPLIGQTLVEAGYDDKYSFKHSKLHKVPEWEDILDYNFPELGIKKPAVLDFGGIGKGYLIDLISKLLIKERTEEFCIDGGGDIYFRSDQVLKVGLEHPGNSEQVIGVAQIENQSICASSNNRRKWGKFHHIIDPLTLKSSENVLATWVVADEAIIADSLATCLFLVDPEKLREVFKFEYLVLFPDLSFSKSNGFPAELFLG